MTSITQSCPTCSGTGTNDGDSCGTCNGTGHEPMTRTNEKPLYLS